MKRKVKLGIANEQNAPSAASEILAQLGVLPLLHTHSQSHKLLNYYGFQLFHFLNEYFVEGFLKFEVFK